MRVSFFAIAALTALVAGCGTVARSSGAMPIGPDTFKLTARAAMGSMVESQKMAFSEANTHCQSLGKNLLTTATSSNGDRGTYEVTFRCLNAGDPDLVRPNLQRAPDTVIQTR